MMKTSPKALCIVLTSLASGGCLVPNVICYENTYSLSGMMSGNSPLSDALEPTQISLTCVNASTGQIRSLQDYVSATEAIYTGELEITNQHDLERLDEMMTSIEAGNGSSMPVGYQTYYTTVIETMTDQMHAGCVAYLAEGYINCTTPSADAVCGAYLSNPTRARYLDLDLGEDYERPISENSGLDVQGAGSWCHYYQNPPPASDTDTDTDGQVDSSSTSSNTTDPSGADESSSADEGSSGEGAAPPFGPPDELVHCNRAQTSCTYDPELIDNVFAASGQVQADGALLRLLGPGDSAYPGLRLEGFDRGEATTELAASVGLAEGDVIRSVDGIRLADDDALARIVDALLLHPAATFVYTHDGRHREVRIEPR